MASYVLVHGGHNDGGVWDRIIPFLTAAGHTVYAPTLADPITTALEVQLAGFIPHLPGADACRSHYNGP
jgi:hypothetical protein